MTWWAEEDRPAELSAPGARARQRWDQLREGSREVVGEPAPGAAFAVRWPMSGWQVWRRIDAVWCEVVDDAVDRDAAIECAAQFRRVRVSP